MPVSYFRFCFFFGYNLGFKLVFGLGPELVCAFTTLWWTAVSSLRGGQGGVPSLTAACVPHFGLLRILFGASRNNETTGNIGKRIITFKDNSCLKFFRFAHQLLYINVSHFHYYGGVAEWGCKRIESLPELR